MKSGTVHINTCALFPHTCVFICESTVSPFIPMVRSIIKKSVRNIAFAVECGETAPCKMNSQSSKQANELLA